MALGAADFPAATPLRHFFAWNERARRPDRRWLIATDPDRLTLALAHSVAAVAARQLADSLGLAAGSADIAAHAAVFAGFEALGATVDLEALARWRQIRPARNAGPRRILVIRLSAFGDFVLSLGPLEAIRRHHRDDHLSLLTTAPFAGFAGALGWFDEVLVDPRPRGLDLGGWRDLRRVLRGGRFDRVYDLQTATRSSFYRRLFAPGQRPEWSGIAARCSHPHANLDRDCQHTIDKQAEQLLMAGIHPTPPARLPPFARDLPELPPGRRFVLLAPGSSPHRPEKRWPAARFATVAQALAQAGHVPVVVGVAAEGPLAREIQTACPAALDLTGRTDIVGLAALTQRAALTIGNDNGVSHLAAAAGCPVVVLFSAASDPARCAPRGRLVQVIAVSELAGLPTERVLATAKAALALPASGERPTVPA